MKRNYQQGEMEGVELFIGNEVEKTPAFGMTTLFVVGVQDVEKLENLVVDRNIQHIFFGANHSFSPNLGDFDSWKPWDVMIEYFLAKGYLCSLDIPLSHAEEFLDSGLNDYQNFIPQIRVPLPYIKLWNYNTMIKIDDKGFDASNPGVWTHSLHSLMNRDNFTDWQAYKKDITV